MKKSLLVLATLGFALSLNAADLTDTCKSYFSDIDKMSKLTNKLVKSNK